MPYTGGKNGNIDAVSPNERLRQTFGHHDEGRIGINGPRERLERRTTACRQLLHQLVKKERIHRITNGTYTFHEETQLVGHAFQPYYYGLQDALSQHHLWDQETNPVVLTPRKVRTGLRQFLGNNYVVRRIDRRLFFGYDLMRYGGFWIYVSDIEKTLIDFCYFKEPLDDQTLDEIRKRIDIKNSLHTWKNARMAGKTR